MLVLSRKQDESILIDGDIRITIVKVNGGHVRVGIEAPRSTNIIRAELCSSGQSVQDAEHCGSGPLDQEAVRHAAGFAGVHDKGTGDSRRIA